MPIIARSIRLSCKKTTPIPNHKTPFHCSMNEKLALSRDPSSPHLGSTLRTINVTCWQRQHPTISFFRASFYEIFITNPSLPKTLNIFKSLVDISSSQQGLELEVQSTCYVCKEYVQLTPIFDNTRTLQHATKPWDRFHLPYLLYKKYVCSLPQYYAHSELPAHPSKPSSTSTTLLKMMQHQPTN